MLFPRLLPHSEGTWDENPSSTEPKNISFGDNVNSLLDYLNKVISTVTAQCQLHSAINWFFGSCWEPGH
jgi:hypothetical protein